MSQSCKIYSSILFIFVLRCPAFPSRSHPRVIYPPRSVQALSGSKCPPRKSPATEDSCRLELQLLIVPISQTSYLLKPHLITVGTIDQQRLNEYNEPESPRSIILVGSGLSRIKTEGCFNENKTAAAKIMLPCLTKMRNGGSGFSVGGQCPPGEERARKVYRVYEEEVRVIPQGVWAEAYSAVHGRRSAGEPARRPSPRDFDPHHIARFCFASVSLSLSLVPTPSSPSTLLRSPPETIILILYIRFKTFSLLDSCLLTPARSPFPQARAILLRPSSSSDSGRLRAEQGRPGVFPFREGCLRFEGARYAEDPFAFPLASTRYTTFAGPATPRPQLRDFHAHSRESALVCV